MKTLNKLHFIGEDTRRRRYLLPTRIVNFQGNVRGAENLLIEKPLQISLRETSATSLHNGVNSPNASIVIDFGVELNGAIRILCADSPEASEPGLLRLVFGESVSEAMSGIGQKRRYERSCHARHGCRHPGRERPGVRADRLSVPANRVVKSECYD